MLSETSNELIAVHLREQAEECVRQLVLLEKDQNESRVEILLGELSDLVRRLSPADAKQIHTIACQCVASMNDDKTLV